jgi:hypothetical protein
VQLKAGGGALVMAQQGQTATVLWIRFTGTKKAEPVADHPAGDKTGEPAGK